MNDITSTSTPITFAQLTPKTCRFPLGAPSDPVTHFCGAQKEDTVKPYCNACMLIAYITPPPRQKKVVDQYANPPVVS